MVWRRRYVLIMKPQPPEPCREPFSPCWCSVAGRENNPHCKTAVPIESNVLTTILIIAGILLVLNALKLINMKTLFNKISTFLFGEKSFRWGELKGL